MNAPSNKLPVSSPLSRIRVAVVGAGYVSQHHLAALAALPFVEVVGIADTDLALARKTAARFRIAHAAASLRELPRADAVYVLTPPRSHCALALAAMERGCHVFVEKPLAESVEECDRMIAKARERGVVLAVNHSDLLDPVVERALSIVRSGAIGQVLNVDFLRSSDYPPYAGGPLPALVAQGSYPFRDLGVHGLYLLEAFAGSIEALDVGYRGTGRNPSLRFDEWHATAHAGAAVGRLQISWNVRPLQSRLLVQGTAGVVEVDRFLQRVRVSRVLPGPKFVGIMVNGFLHALRDAVGIPLNVLRFVTGRLKPSPGIRRGAEDFARALHEGRAPATGAEQGRRIIELMEPACRGADAQWSAELEARLAPLAPADVVVTGANGFVGRALVARLLASGQRVRVLVRRREGLAPAANLQAVVGDLGDPRIVAHALSGVPLVYHVGAAMKGAPQDFAAGTLWGTRNVIDACVANASRLVYVSSMSVLDHAGRKPGVPVCETSPLEPFPERRGAYTQTKLAAEQMVLEAIRDRGLRAVVIRPGQIFGPGAEHTTPNATVRLAGRWIAVGSASQTLPLVYLDDVIDALERAATRPDALGRTIHVVDPAPVTQEQYLRHCREKLGAGLRIVRVPMWLFVLLGGGVEALGKVLKRNVPLTRYRVRSLRPLADFELDAARTGLGWSPRVGAQEGLRRTFGPAADA